MGLRDEAEKALRACEDQRRAARRMQVDAERERYADAALGLRVSFAAWCASMEIDEIPELRFEKANEKFGTGENCSYSLYFTFEADTLNFDGTFDQRESLLKIHLVPDSGCIRSDPIHSIADLGHAIRRGHVRVPSYARSEGRALETWQGWRD